MVQQHDRDEDGLLNRQEIPWGPALAQRPEVAGRGLGGDLPVKLMFGASDTSGDGVLYDRTASALYAFTTL